MKFLMLRGQVPTDRNPREIMFDRIEECDDVWTQLFYAMLDDNDYGELWYWGGSRRKMFDANFLEQWLPDFTHKTALVPDVIFCRGGFSEYHKVLHRFPDAIKIYYGAGRRFLPQLGFDDYDIILQDSPEQVEICKEKFPNALTTLFIKPASDNIFYPIKKEKTYDVCFPANGSQAFKGHKFVYETAPEHLKILNLGNRSRFVVPTNVASHRVLRSEMAECMSFCKVGIVVVESAIDSCPRVIPEMLACNIPIVVLEGVRFWVDKYMVEPLRLDPKLPTGVIANRDDFWGAVDFLLKERGVFRPAAYYRKHLSLKHAAKFLRSKINEVSI